jgi:hypothetical protein
MGDPTIRRSIARIGDIDMFCRDTNTDGPAMLCLHGRWGRGETWVDFLSNAREFYGYFDAFLKGLD